MSGEGSELPEGEKNFEKKLKKPLTNSPKSDRIKMFREGQKKEEKDTPQTRKAFIMKKATLQYLVNLMNENIALNGGEEESQEEYVAARDELVAELSKGQARKDATAAAYTEMWKVVRQALADAVAPVTAQEIADVTGLSRGMIVYGLSHSWANEVDKDTSGKSTTYALKA